MGSAKMKQIYPYLLHLLPASYLINDNRREGYFLRIYQFIIGLLYLKKDTYMKYLSKRFRNSVCFMCQEL